MSITGETASLSGSSLKGRDHTSASTIAAFNKRRLYGDYGKQPNAPSVGIDLQGEAASQSAIRAAATREKLGPKLWYPEASESAQRASTLASSNSSSFIPEAHYVEDPHASALASQAATSAIQVSGEEYGAKHQPEAYKWGKQQSQWSHLGAQRSSAAAARDEEAYLSTGSFAPLTRKPPQQSIDISKVLAAAQANAKHRLESAENHLPANFGVKTEEEKAQRRQQVLSLISIADARVKARMAELDKDARAPMNVFGSIEFQKIALEVATKTHSGRLDNHGKLNLGGGLYMTQDEVDDIARRHVQPVLDKVTLVAEKKRIADREHAEREALRKKLAADEKEAEKQRRAEEKQRQADEKASKRHAELVAKQKRDRAAARAKESHAPGTHLWHWQQVEIIKEDVKEAKFQRDLQQKRLEELEAQRTQAKEDLAALTERHRELKKDYFDRGDAIDKKAAEYDENAPETASLFDLKQKRETVKASTKNAKVKRTELEEQIADFDAQITALEDQHKETEQHHRDLKKKYFDAKAEAEEAEKKFQIEEEARLKREAEERAKREAEAEQRRKEEAQRKADAEAARAQAKAAGVASAPAASASAGTPAAKSTTAKSTSASAPKANSAAVDTAASDFVPPPKSQLLGLGDAKSGPILSGYKNTVPTPAKKSSSGAETPEKSDVKAEENAEANAEANADEKTEDIEENGAKVAPIVPAAVETPLNEKAKAERASSREAAAASEPVEAAAETAAVPTTGPTETPVAAAVETPKTEALKTEATKTEETSTVPTAPIVPAAVETPLNEKAKTERVDSAEDEAKVEAVESKDAAKEEIIPVPKTLDPTATGAAGSGVAGAVTEEGPANPVTLKEDIPLGDSKDQFSGFDSSNVKEKKVDGVFKEDL